MFIKDLDKGEYFTYNKHRYKHNGYIYNQLDVIDTIDDEGRHRPFKHYVEVEPEQMRISEYQYDPSFKKGG